jgi:hypothetical protein
MKERHRYSNACPTLSIFSEMMAHREESGASDDSRLQSKPQWNGPGPHLLNCQITAFGNKDTIQASLLIRSIPGGLGSATGKNPPKQVSVPKVPFVIVPRSWTGSKPPLSKLYLTTHRGQQGLPLLALVPTRYQKCEPTGILADPVPVRLWVSILDA